MLVYIENSNIFEVGVIAHGCNAKGVFGAGVAKQVAEKYPAAKTSYFNHLDEMYKRDLTALGTVDFHPVSKHLLIVNMITQEFYGKKPKDYVDYTAIHATMQRVIDISKKLYLDVHIPFMVGCGLGGGNLDTIIEIYNSFTETIYCHRLRHAQKI